ncbi:MAG: bifunctional diguanylate cyclase/phosphodiesterase [Pseudomonadota bacterium]
MTSRLPGRQSGGSKPVLRQKGVLPLPTEPLALSPRPSLRKKPPVIAEPEAPQPVATSNAPSSIRPTGIEAEAAAILQSIGEVIYAWDVASGAMNWAGCVDSVLGVEPAKLNTNTAFAGHLHGENLVSRYDAVMASADKDNGSGVFYQVQYGFTPDPTDPDNCIWLEDTGRWFAGPDGKPERAQGVVRAINERHEREQRLAYLSRFDELTGQVNRTHLLELLDEAIRASGRDKDTGGFLVVAIDNLATINSTFGFDVADEVIKTVAQRLKEHMRGGDVLGRHSGNKFGVVLGRCTEQDMEIAARRLRHAIRSEVIDTAAGGVSASVSMGGVVFPRQARTVHETMIRALEALDMAKASGRDNFAGWRASEERESARQINLRIADEIVAAVNGNQFSLALQPIVSAGSGALDFSECLLRLRDSEGTYNSAARLIPAAERLGLMHMIDRHVLDLAARIMHHRKDEKFSINVSAGAAEDGDWYGALIRHAREIPNFEGRLIVEVTETMAIEDIEKTKEFNRKIRDLGCQFAVDDFGAGYTSFRNLRMLDVDMVKIDGSYVVGIHKSVDDQVFVRTLVELARNFGIRTVAEFVEEQADADLLATMGIDCLQGYLFGVPKVATLPPEQTRLAS